MDFASFKQFWDTAISRRDENLDDRDLLPWFRDRKFPPIIGFGLPSEGRPITLATVGLNPSDHEVLDGHAPSGDDPEEQWSAQQGYFKHPYKSWFDRADLIVRSVSGDRASYGGQYGSAANALHIDVSVHPTVGKFDTVYDKKANKRERERAIEMLEAESTEVFFPLIDLLRREHGLANVVVFGFCPPSWGSRTMKALWAKKEYWDIVDSTASHKIRLARARLTTQRSRQVNQSSLDEVNWVFVSQGPSSRSHDSMLRDAAAEIHRRGWLL